MSVGDAFRNAVEALCDPLAASQGVEMGPEERLRRAVAEALRAQPQIAEVVTSPEWRPEMPLWPRVQNGRLGGFDISFRTAGASAFTGVAETKWSGGGIDALDEVLWDAFKLAHAEATLPGVTDAFLVYGVTAQAWKKPPRYAQLFTDGVWDSRDLVVAHPSVWAWAVRGSSRARPLKLPPNLETALLADCRCTLNGVEWSIRCARVRANGEPWIELDESAVPEPPLQQTISDWWYPEPGPGMEPDPAAAFVWPAPDPPQLADDEVSALDVPAPEADWQRIQWFAGSLDGYRAFGGVESLAAFGDTVELFFDRVGELPPLDLHGLRACLFYEYRRHQQLGHYPDARSTGYIRTVVETIRARVNDDPRGASQV